MTAVAEPATPVPIAAPPGPPAAPKSRAGRNLPAAIAVGVVLGGTCIISLFTERPVFAALVVLAGVVGLRELTRALRPAGVKTVYPALLAAGIGIDVVAYLDGSLGALLALAGSALFVVLVTCGFAFAERHDPSRRRITAPSWAVISPVGDAIGSVFAVVYVPYLASFAAVLAAPHDGARRVVAFIATVVASDIGGYAFGVLSGGRHKLAPRISPGKSWEGFVGSVLTSLVVGLILMTTLLHESAWKGALFGVVMAVVAVLGDLLESALKRGLGVKDMGRLLPGHGGLLDRLDSLLLAAPVAWALLTAFVSTS